MAPVHRPFWELGLLGLVQYFEALLVKMQVESSIIRIPFSHMLPPDNHRAV